MLESSRIGIGNVVSQIIQVNLLQNLTSEVHVQKVYTCIYYISDKEAQDVFWTRNAREMEVP